MLDDDTYIVQESIFNQRYESEDIEYGSSVNSSSEPPDQSNEENEDRRSQSSSEPPDQSNEENEDRRDDDEIVVE